jgi:chromosome segregation ATPase
MALSTPLQDRRMDVIDYLFSNLSAGGEAAPPVAPSAAGRLGPRASAPAPDEVEEPPCEEGDLTPQQQLACGWLRRERARLEAYTRAQLSRVLAERQAAAAQLYLNEQALVLRAQEVSRKEEFVAGQVRAMQEQAEQLSRREKALLGQLEQQRERQEEAADFDRAAQDVCHEVESQQALLTTLQAETSALQAARDAARAELAAMEAALPAQREALAKERAALTAGREQAEARALALDNEQMAMQRRLDELDEVETQLRRELEMQERQLATERREVAELRSRLRVRALQGNTSR